MAYYVNSGDSEKSHYESVDVNQPQPSSVSLQCSTTTGHSNKGVSCGVHDQCQSTKKAENSRSVAHYVQWTILYLALVTIVALLIWVRVEQTVTDETLRNNFGEFQGGTPSCLDLIGQGVTKDGFYNLTPPGESLPITVYCDMTTDGGGWTLVASVHEDEIQRKCDAQDLWSTYLTQDRAEHAGKGNWENEITFGNAMHLHLRDYKNAGYSNMIASDVMIWHVVQGFQIASLKSSTKLRYRTNNKFLKNYGGNLQTLYDKHFPLKVDTETQYHERKEAQATTVLDALERNSAAIKSSFPDFYEYSYGFSTHEIRDSKLYLPYGNNLDIAGPGCHYNIPYGASGNCGRSVLLSTRKSHPFFFVAVISNEERNFIDIRLKVKSKRPNTYDVLTFHTNILTNGNFKLQYHVVQHSRNSTFTTCEFHYVVSNLKDWNSVEPTLFYLYRAYHTSSDIYRDTEYKIEGHSVSNVVMGYVLLARQNPGYVNESQLDNVGQEILNVFANLTTLFHSFGKKYAGLTVPVTFDQGTSADVMNMIPPNYRESVEPGFIQFRAYYASGFPNALCPGVMLKSGIPEYICIGGVSKTIGDRGTCGDFAGWNGKQDDKVQKTTAVGSAHSIEDTTSTILIFYR